MHTFASADFVKPESDHLFKVNGLAAAHVAARILEGAHRYAASRYLRSQSASSSSQLAGISTPFPGFNALSPG